MDSEGKICNDLLIKYPDLEPYKTSKRFKVQKKNVEEILKIITDNSDKDKFNEFLSMYNMRKGKTTILEKKPLEKIKKEKVKTIEKTSDSINNSNNSINNSIDNSNNSTDNPFKKQRDIVLKKLSQLQNDYDELEEKYDNLNNVHNEFKVSYKEACHERNKLELLTEKKGWTKDIREEFDKYKSFYQKYIEHVDELNKIKN